MSTEVVANGKMVRFCRVLSVWWIALAVGWASVAVAGPSEDMIAAASRGDRAAVQALLAKGADVNAKDNGGRTALMMATVTGHPDVVQTLLAMGAEVNAK